MIKNLKMIDKKTRKMNKKIAIDLKNKTAELLKFIMI